MKNRFFKRWIVKGLVVLSFMVIPHVQADTLDNPEAPDSVQAIKTSLNVQDTQIPSAALEDIHLLDFKNTEIKDIVRGLATKYNLNVFIDDAVRQRVTLRLTDISVHDALEFLVRENELKMTLENNIYKISLPELPKPEPKPLLVSYENNLLSVDLKNEDIEKSVYAIAKTSGKNILLNRGVEGSVSGLLQNIPFEQGLTTLMKGNGYHVRKQDGIYFIERDYMMQMADGQKQRKSFWVNVEDSLITLDVMQADLGSVIRETASQLGTDLFILSDLSGQVNAKCSGLKFDDVLDYLFKGTNFTYRQDGDIYLIGDKSISGIISTQLIRLNHIKADGIIDLLPPVFSSKAVLQTIKEHNSLMVVGAQDVIREVEGFVDQIDHPIAQILIEAVVVDYQDTDISELGLRAWMSSPADSIVSANQFLPTYDVTANSDLLNKSISFYGPQLGIKNLGRLPDGFLINLKALEQDKKANVRSIPQIATLNGHPASIKIGQTQYYKLKSERPIVGGNQVFNQVMDRFEKITAEISLMITPWVSASGEITTEIKPEFSTPHGGFNAETPPTIDHRVLESTVRLRDGETIVLGGLMQTNDSKTIDKVPILGSIPILGRIFQYRSNNLVKSKLMIYITPHLTYSEDYRPDYEGVIR